MAARRESRECLFEVATSVCVCVRSSVFFAKSKAGMTYECSTGRPSSHTPALQASKDEHKCSHFSSFSQFLSPLKCLVSSSGDYDPSPVRGSKRVEVTQLDEYLI